MPGGLCPPPTWPRRSPRSRCARSCPRRGASCRCYRAARLEAPAVGAGKEADAPGHAVGLVLGEALLDSRDDISPAGHGHDADVAVQRVEEGDVAVVEVGALAGLGNHDDDEAVLGSLTGKVLQVGVRRLQAGVLKK